MINVSLLSQLGQNDYIFMKKISKFIIKIVLGMYIIIANIFHEHFGLIIEGDVSYLIGFNLTITLLYFFSGWFIYSAFQDIKRDKNK